MTSSEYEKIIDMAFWETPSIVIIPGLGLVTNIWNFRITNYEVGVGIHFQKLPNKKGSEFLKM
jgi:hypothetical protein